MPDAGSRGGLTPRTRAGGSQRGREPADGSAKPARELRDGATQPKVNLKLAWERNGGTAGDQPPITPLRLTPVIGCVRSPDPILAPHA
jgi:hypothetical protein